MSVSHNIPLLFAVIAFAVSVVFIFYSPSKMKVACDDRPKFSSQPNFLRRPLGKFIVLNVCKHGNSLV